MVISNSEEALKFRANAPSQQVKGRGKKNTYRKINDFLKR